MTLKIDMFEQHISRYIKPNLDLPNYKQSVFCQRISQLHRKYDPNTFYKKYYFDTLKC